MHPEYVNAVVTLVVGFVALAVYWLTKRTERQNAAIVLMMDIRHAEQTVFTILEKSVIDRSMRAVLVENNWAKYKHLFARSFSSDDFAAFNRFFDACAEIEDARRMMVQVFYSNLHGKAAAVQERLLSIGPIEDSCPENKELRRLVIQRVDSEEYAFEPGEPKNRVLRGLQLMGRLTNTIAFEKLKRISGVDS